ncbi:putative signal peptide protein [Puccinia sorghi]|uniref:Putative signal peptide protein n=1 Tax=Puccinia sorghi TaxID=27349 RepID=A0A0L6VT76_9BASI|nr:putative signal peptide protein [Puccinia sorghi]
MVFAMILLLSPAFFLSPRCVPFATCHSRIPWTHTRRQWRFSPSLNSCYICHVPNLNCVYVLLYPLSQGGLDTKIMGHSTSGCSLFSFKLRFDASRFSAMSLGSGLLNLDRLNINSKFCLVQNQTKANKYSSMRLKRRQLNVGLMPRPIKALVVMSRRAILKMWSQSERVRDKMIWRRCHSSHGRISTQSFEFGIRSSRLRHLDSKKSSSDLPEFWQVIMHKKNASSCQYYSKLLALKIGPFIHLNLPKRLVIMRGFQISHRLPHSCSRWQKHNYELFLPQYPDPESSPHLEPQWSEQIFFFTFISQPAKTQVSEQVACAVKVSYHNLWLGIGKKGVAICLGFSILAVQNSPTNDHKMTKLIFNINFLVAEGLDIPCLQQITFPSKIEDISGRSSNRFWIFVLIQEILQKPINLKFINNFATIRKLSSMKSYSVLSFHIINPTGLFTNYLKLNGILIEFYLGLPTGPNPKFLLLLLVIDKKDTSWFDLFWWNLQLRKMYKLFAFLQMREESERYSLNLQLNSKLNLVALNSQLYPLFLSSYIQMLFLIKKFTPKSPKFLCYDLATPSGTCQGFPQLGDYLQPPHLCTFPS